MMPSRLAEISAVLREVSARAEALGASLTPKQMLLRPDPNRWSPAECLAHLTITANAYAPVWRDAFTDARQRGARGSEPFSMDFVGRMLNWSLEPGRRRYKAPAHMQPINVASGEAALEAFLDSQQMVQQFLIEGAGLPLDRMKIASPAVAAIRYSVWSSFVIIGTHGRRHLAQAEVTASASR
jgi:hypothetical protein